MNLMQRLIILAAMFAVASCSSQTEMDFDPNTGNLTKLRSNKNFLAKGSNKANGDQYGNAEKAAEELGEYGDKLLKAGILKTGIQELGDLADEGLDLIE